MGGMRRISIRVLRSPIKCGVAHFMVGRSSIRVRRSSIRLLRSLIWCGVAQFRVRCSSIMMRRSPIESYVAQFRVGRSSLGYGAAQKGAE